MRCSLLSQRVERGQMRRLHVVSTHPAAFRACMRATDRSPLEPYGCKMGLLVRKFCDVQLTYTLSQIRAFPCNTFSPSIALSVRSCARQLPVANTAVYVSHRAGAVAAGDTASMKYVLAFHRLELCCGHSRAIPTTHGHKKFTNEAQDKKKGAKDGRATNSALRGGTRSERENQ